MPVSHMPVGLTYLISRKARFSTSFTLYLRLNLQKGKCGEHLSSCGWRVGECGSVSIPSRPSHCGISYLARSRGSIIFLFWKLLNLSRRMLPSGCGTEGRGDFSGILDSTGVQTELSIFLKLLEYPQVHPAQLQGTILHEVKCAIRARLRGQRLQLQKVRTPKPG